MDARRFVERREAVFLEDQLGRIPGGLGIGVGIGQDEDFLPGAELEAGNAGFAVHEHQRAVAQTAARPQAEVRQREQIGPGVALLGRRRGQEQAERLVEPPAPRFFRDAKRDAAAFGAVRKGGHSDLVVGRGLFDGGQAGGDGDDAEEEPEEIHVGLQR